MRTIAETDDLDLSSVRLFLTVVELGSVSKAAARHGLSQPSATARLQKLERQLGVGLLDRGPTGSKTTADGIQLAPACAELLTVASQLINQSEQLRDEHSRVSVAATRHVVDHFLSDWVSATDLADVRLDITEADTLRVAQAVRSGETLIGFTDGPQAPIGLRSQVVVSERLVPVVGRSHRWFGRRRGLPPTTVASATLVLQAPGSGTRDVVDAALAQHAIGAMGEHVEVPSATAARLAVLNGDGVAFLPTCRIERDLEHGALTQVPVVDTRIVQPVRIVWRGGRPSVRTARRLLAAIASA
ncbi:LysR family transcriptional regulator [Euzebya tangerina]|uniref:LysR family transcriptional regulator n=1 Tax=Euzebya tangerina TaxID=591198 RepID=UPI000E31B1A0|nr:LysR family transcriptional regulator [Euzebya tangerina]